MNDNTSDADKPVSTTSGIRLERKSNKKTAWNTTPNDTSYPSEKLVKDELDNIEDGTTVVGKATKDADGNVLSTTYQKVSEKGSANGYAELDASGLVPSTQLPSYVDDVLEYADYASLPATGESNKIYVALDTNKTYRWSGTVYVFLSDDVTLGETEHTAYRGDRGKTAYDHSQIADGSNPHGTTFANIASKPTTLAGYGITNAYSKDELDEKKVDKVSGSSLVADTEIVKLAALENQQPTITLNNKIIHGEVDSTTGWVVSSATLSLSSNILSIIGNGTATNPRTYRTFFRSNKSN